ncbi:methylmalonyl-CoA epimerase, mitochondrial [Aplysia californica]|uniref:Methylmalonyl-CoA epimerase, mitochondrial n=1 Tax=Aplysia californica TaxID=6500 RepID=A0ABM0JMX5_APLCA|nr:methylmalonyl-CoA epimerase, mitochondrial [Aplysia californica]
MNFLHRTRLITQQTLTKLTKFGQRNGQVLNKIEQTQNFCSSVHCLKDNTPWNLGKINHIALVTPDLDKSTALYRDVLGGKVSEKQPLPDHGVTTVFVELGDTKIELLHPLGEKSPIQSFLKKNASGGMHHICIEVDDIQKAMADLKSKNIRLLSEEPKIGAHGYPVVFLHPKDCDGVLVELEEVK